MNGVAEGYYDSGSSGLSLDKEEGHLQYKFQNENGVWPPFLSLLSANPSEIWKKI